MDIHHLKVFASVYRNSSFSRATEELYLTQPTVSEHVKRLEEELQVKLFDRIGRRVVPTKEAELLYARAVEIIEKLKDIKTDMNRIRDEARGLLTIGTGTIPGTYIIPPLAAEFRKKYPEVFFQVVIDNSKKIMKMVTAGELLVGVVGTRISGGGLEYVPFVEDELVLAVPPRLLNKKTISIRELAGVPFLLREEGSGTRRTTEKYLLEKGVRLRDMNVVAVLGSTESVREAVKSGFGASFLSRFAIRDDLKAGVIEDVKIKGLRLKQSFYIITHKKRTLPGYHRAFLDYLKGTRFSLLLKYL